MAEQGGLVRLRAERPFELDWRGFELHPETPAGGVPLTALFPAAAIERMRPRLLAFAESYGVRGMRMNDWLPNTRRALAIAELARDQGKLDAFRAEAMHGHWMGGRNLEDDGDLAAIAGAAGLDAPAAVSASRDPAYLGRVDTTRREAERLGVRAIPTFFIAGEAIVGCQPVEVLRQAVDELGGG